MIKTKIKWTVFFIIMLCVVAITAMKFFGQKNYEVIPIVHEAKKDFVIYTEAQGQIHAGKEAFLTIKLGGKLDRIYVKVGEQVEENKIIAAIDEKSNKAGLQSALANFRLASAELNRIKNLYQHGATTHQELDLAQSNFLVKKSDLEKAKERLEDSLVRASMSGVLTQFAFQEGDFIPDGSRLGIIEDHSSYKVVISIPSQFKNQLPPSEVVIVEKKDPQTMNVMDRTELKISLEIANLKNSYDGMDTDVVIQFKELPKNFSVSDFIHLKIPIQTISEVVSIPSRGLIWREESPYVLTRSLEGQLRWLQVKVIDTMGSETIISELPPNTQLVYPEKIKEIEKIVSKGIKTKIVSIKNQEGV